MKKLLRHPDSVMCMSNVRGKYVVHPSPLKFSFYFSANDRYSHGIRVRPVFNPEKMLPSMVGSLKLCDDWEYVPGKLDKDVSEKDVKSMKAFFRRYVVLFCMVWDEQLQDGVLDYYLTGRISFHDLLEDIDFYTQYKAELDNIQDVSQLEQFCRDIHLVNLRDN